MVNMENYEEYMLLYADGELNEVEEKELLAFVAQYPQLQEELKLYAATRVVPNTEIVYEGKEDLLKATPAKRAIALNRRWIYTAAAACVAMMLFFVFNKENINEPVVAHHTSTIKNTVQRPAPPADTEEFHSIPVDPISVKQAATQQPMLAAKHTTVKKQPKTKLPHQETVIAKKEEQKPTVKEYTQPNITQPNKIKEEQQPVVVQNEQPNNYDDHQPAQTTPHEKDKRLLDIINRDRFEGAKMIAQAFDEKAEKVKNIKRKIQDTDVALKIGKREILIVRF